MTIIKEGNLTFNFDFDAIKAIDILAVNKKEGYLIEIKDYRHSDTKSLKISELIPVIVDKVLFTLSAILPMKQNAFDDEEKAIASKFCRTDKIKIILHIEKPPPRSKLEQSTYKFEDIEVKLKQRFKPIDAHPKVVRIGYLKNLPWTVK